VLKVLLNVRNEVPVGAPPTDMSRTVRILGEFGDESNLPLRLSPHAGVVPIIHAFKGSTEAFQRFLGVQYTEEAVREDRLQMTRQTWMVRPLLLSLPCEGCSFGSMVGRMEGQVFG
jgi:hypothetical protein